jgi:hypothetical protein
MEIAQSQTVDAGYLPAKRRHILHTWAQLNKPDNGWQNRKQKKSQTVENQQLGLFLPRN